mgnify:CR=1 FL=1
MKITRRRLIRHSLLGLGVASAGAAFWAGLGVLVGYTLLANQLAGLRGLQSAIAAAVVLVIGLALVALKAFVH